MLAAMEKQFPGKHATNPGFPLLLAYLPETNHFADRQLRQDQVIHLASCISYI